MKRPDWIYLQWEGDGEGEVTWCVDKINDDDIKYVCDGVAEARIAELETRIIGDDRNFAYADAEIARLKARIAELERENAQIVELSDLIKAKADEYKARIAELKDALERANGFTNMWADACNTAITQRDAAEARIVELERENDKDLYDEIADWLFENAHEYNDGQLSYFEIVKDIYLRLHTTIADYQVELEAAESRVAELERQVNMWAKACSDAITQRDAAEARIAELERLLTTSGKASTE